MPSPKAVIRDIHDLNLNPKVKHKTTDKSGRLIDKSSKDLENQQTESVEQSSSENKELKSALVTLTKEKKEPEISNTELLEKIKQDQTEIKNSSLESESHNESNNEQELKFEKRFLKKKR